MTRHDVIGVIVMALMVLVYDGACWMTTVMVLSGVWCMMVYAML